MFYQILLTVFLAVSTQAALTVQVTSVSQTQAVFVERGFSGTCTIVVSATNGGPPIHDFDASLYPSSNTDTGRTDTVTSLDGLTRTVFVGHKKGDRALGVFTPYYYTYSGCGSATGSFTTANISSGVTRTERPPFNAAKWGNLDFPTFDWTAIKKYILPDTGATITPMINSTLTWRTGGGASGPTSQTQVFADCDGGTGWTNPCNAVNGSTSNAATSNTNVLDLYADLNNGGDPLPYNFARTLEDFAVKIWGKATGCTGTDCIIDICVILNPVTGCASNSIAVTLSNGGSVVQAASGSGDPDQPWPVAFPTSPFFGWTGSSSPLIRMENQTTFGSVAISGNTLTITTPTPQTHFSSALTTGSKILVTGSSPTCTNNLCTLASPPNAGTATIVENLGAFGTVTFRSYGWGFRIKSRTAFTKTIGAQYKLAGSLAPLGAMNDCNHNSVTSADGKVGYMCQVTAFQPGLGFLVFVANDGTTRFLSNRYGVGFDASNGNIAYQAVNNGSGWSISKLTYTGNYLANLYPNGGYNCSNSISCPAFTDDFTSLDLMPHASNKDLDQQVTSLQGTSGLLPPYNFTKYGHWVPGTAQQFSSTGHYFFFGINYSGQGQLTGGGPGWIAAVDFSSNPAVLTGLCHTLDGAGFCPNAILASLHSVQTVPAKDNVVFISGDQAHASNTSLLYGGPWQAQVQDVLLSVGPLVWSGHAGGAGAGTCLSYPQGTIGTSGCASATYYTSCPTTIFTCSSGAWPTANGTPYTDFITLRLPLGGICNTSASTAEAAAAPCPWNAAFGNYPLLAPGMKFYDDIGGGGDHYDWEQFRALEVVNGGATCGAFVCVFAARNAVPVTCGLSPWQGNTNPDAGQSIFQAYHANNWTLTMSPGTWDTCGVMVLLIDMTDVTHPQELGHPFTNHFATGRNSPGVNFVLIDTAAYNTPFLQLQNIPVKINKFAQSFQGLSSYIIGGELQNYTDNSQSDAGAAGRNAAIDTNPAVASTFEVLDSAFGNVLRTLTHITGDVYKIQPQGNGSLGGLTLATYKQQPMIGWAGRYILKDVSGPSSNIDTNVWGMCHAAQTNECHTGSVANDVYVNVPQMYNPALSYCSASVSWPNDPCILFGDNAPAGGFRQFGMYKDDLTGAHSRWISNGWSSIGRQYPLTRTTLTPGGQWGSQGGTQLIDGFNIGNNLTSVPPWEENSDAANLYKQVTVKLPAGLAFATIRFGYSEYDGFCTPRSENCNAGAGGTPFVFDFEGLSGTACTSGCTISINVVSGKVLEYQIGRSASSGSGYSYGDTYVTAIQ